MTVPTLVAAGRAAHTRLLVDTCVIDHPEAGVFDPVTGGYPLTWTTVYSGPCRVKGPTAGNAAVDQAQAGEAEQTVARPVLVLPHGTAPDVAVGDRVTVTRTGSATSVYTVVGAVDATTMTAAAFQVEAVTVDRVTVFGGSPDSAGDDVIDGGAP